MTTFARLPANVRTAIGYVVGILCIGGGCNALIPDVPSIDLREVASDAVPDSFLVAHVVSADNGVFALTAANWPHLLVGREGVWTEFGAGLLQRPVGIAFASDGSIAEVVDGALQAILHFTGDRIVRTEPIPLDPHIYTALYSETAGWYVAAVDSIGTTQVYWRGMDRGQHGIIDIDGLPTDAATNDVILAFSPSGSLIVARRRQPYVWALVDGDRQVRIIDVYDKASKTFRSGSTRFLDPLWVAIGVLPVSGNLLYSLADLRSSDRRLLLVTPDGRLVRQTKFEGPMGFVYHIPGQPRVIAVRDLGKQEIVTYGWGEGSELTSNRNLER